MAENQQHQQQHKGSLFDAIKNRQWHKAQSILRDKKIRQEEVEYLGRSDRFDNCNSLHLFFTRIHGDCTQYLTILDDLLSASHRAPLQCNEIGQTPLHLAFGRMTQGQMPEMALIKIIRSCPAVASVADPCGNLPLLYSLRLCLLETMKQILILHPEVNDVLSYFFGMWDMGLQWALRQTCVPGSSSEEPLLQLEFRNGFNTIKRSLQYLYDATMLLFKAYQNGSINEEEPLTPFEAARISLTHNQCPWSFWGMILKINPAIAFEINKSDGNSLLHIAATSPETLGQRSFCVLRTQYEETLMKKYFDDYHQVEKVQTAIKDLLHRNTAAATLPNNKGQLPLHLALEHSLPSNAVMALFDVAPNALESRDMSTLCYPFMTAACCGVNESTWLVRFTLCYELLMNCPNLVIMPGSGKRGGKRRRVDVDK